MDALIDALVSWSFRAMRSFPSTRRFLPWLKRSGYEKGPSQPA